MSNVALDQLNSLLALEQGGQDADANLKKVQDARNQFLAPRPADDEANFAAPEALATAVGAGFILGPAGGLLLGLTQGILGKRAEQNALDQYNREAGIISKANDIFNDEIDRQVASATNPDDIAQLTAMQSQKDAALQMMTSANPTIQQKGTELFADFSTRMNDFATLQEEQSIERDTLRRELGQELYDRHLTLNDKFRADSANFEAQQATANNIIESINRGDGASVTAALATLPLLVNPDAGATTEAEVEIWSKVGGTVDSLLGKVQKELGSGGLTDDTRREILGVATQYKRNSISFQQAREAYYGEQMQIEGLPQQLAGQYNLSGRLPVVQQGGFVKGESLAEQKTTAGEAAVEGAVEGTKNFATEFIDNTSMQINDYLDERKHEKAWREEFFRIHGSYPADDLGMNIQ